MKYFLASLLLCVSTLCQAQAIPPDPCAANPALLTTCAGYNNVQTTNNLVPYPSHYAVNGGTISQTYAINQALALSGAGIVVNGFQYGFKYQLGASSTTCTATNQDGSCSWWMATNNYANVGVSIRDNNNSVLRAFNHPNNGSNSGVQERSYVYILPSTRAPETFGNFIFNAATGGNSSIWGMYSRVMYTHDPCIADPLSSTSCAGYAQAYHDQQCTANPLYAVTCNGYQAAYTTQQCTSNPLYDVSCTGYAQAYYTQQCSSNPLYDSGCTGYQQAYFTQQCTANPLYSNQCTGYAQAYLTQQCTSNPLYSNQCTGYQAAYHNQQCGLNPLYMSDCAGYQAAYFTQQCNLNGLYDRTCPNYSTAYATKMSAENTTSIVSTSTTTVATTDTTTSSNTATVAISNPVVRAAVTTPDTTSQTSPTSVINPPKTQEIESSIKTVSVDTAPSAAQQQERAADEKKTAAVVSTTERKSSGNQQVARTAVVEQAKELAKKSGEAATMEAQVATQGLQVGLMGYVPGFSAYQNSIVPDTLGTAVARQYHKPNVDNRSAQRRLSGANEASWKQMVDSQYKQ